MGAWARNPLVASAAYVRLCTQATTTGGATLRAAQDCEDLHDLGGG